MRVKYPPPDPRIQLTSSTHASEEHMPDIQKEADSLGIIEVPADKL
jgi:hypothetical protein